MIINPWQNVNGGLWYEREQINKLFPMSSVQSCCVLDNRYNCRQCFLLQFITANMSSRLLVKIQGNQTSCALLALLLRLLCALLLPNTRAKWACRFCFETLQTWLNISAKLSAIDPNSLLFYTSSVSHHMLTIHISIVCFRSFNVVPCFGAKILYLQTEFV